MAVEELPQWITVIGTAIPTLTASILSARFYIAKDVMKLDKKLTAHIIDDKESQTAILKELRENTKRTIENSKTTKSYNANDLFFSELIRIGVDTTKDVEKHIKEKGGSEDEIKKAHIYVNSIIDGLTNFSRTLLTVKIEDAPKAIVYSKASIEVQKATVMFRNLWGDKHSAIYCNNGENDRTNYINKVLAIKTDIANNKTDRFRKTMLSYAHEMTAGFCRYYYSNDLANYKEGKDEK